MERIAEGQYLCSSLSYGLAALQESATLQAVMIARRRKL
jgi:hypothetical protein